MREVSFGVPIILSSACLITENLAPYHLKNRENHTATAIAAITTPKHHLSQ